MKHYDNKNDLIREMKMQKFHRENDIAAVFKAYMLLATLTLYEDLGFREKRIINMRFYNGKTQMEIADEIGISQAQVSRLEKGALERIKKNM